MRVAVLLSAYNGEKYLLEQVHSIMRQKGRFDIDIWIRDDGSCDNTNSLLASIESSRIKVTYGKNIGPANSFFALLRSCGEYDYYAFADQDDIWLPDKIDVGIKSIQSLEGPAIYCCNAYLVDENGRYLHRKVYKNDLHITFETLSCEGGILGCSMIFNLPLARVFNGATMPDKIIMHDFYLSLLCLSVDGEMIYDSIPRFLYRQHRNNAIGVSHNLAQRIRSRCRTIFVRQKVSIADQANCIILLHGREINADKCDWLYSIASYRKSLINRIALAFSNRLRFRNLNTGVTLRLSILFGSR